jgi:protein gp37
VSQGCVNCYAERVAHRFSKPGLAYEGLTDQNGRWNGVIRVAEQHMLDPLKWKQPCRIFVNSMSDLFHENVSDETIDRIFAVMALCPQHTFQILTKRPERMLAYLSTEDKASDLMDVQIDMADWNYSDRETSRITDRALRKIGEKTDCGYDPMTNKEHTYIYMPKIDVWPLPNVWLGVSVEDQKTADERIPLLLQTPAAVRWISAEPLLGSITLEELPSASGIGRYLNALSNAGVDSGATIAAKLDWVVIGGESGTSARPFDIAWAQQLIDQCKAAGVACFMKQLGNVPMMAEEIWKNQAEAGRLRILNASNERRVPEGFVPLYSVGKAEAFDSLPYELRVRQYPEARNAGL